MSDEDEMAARRAARKAMFKQAVALGETAAAEVVRSYMQDNGDHPRALVIDLWGSATMRTAGEEFAMALHLAGLAPLWDSASGRVTGFEVIPLALLDRPRIDVTLRVSGLFRDVFPGLATLFETGAAMLADRDETAADNPYVTRAARVFGPKPGQYGLGMGVAMDDFTPEARAAAGEAWLAASSWAIGIDGQSRDDRAGLEARLKTADSFVHAQDLPESDVLLAGDYAAHEAGFAAALQALLVAHAVAHVFHRAFVIQGRTVLRAHQVGVFADPQVLAPLVAQHLGHESLHEAVTLQPAAKLAAPTWHHIPVGGDAVDVLEHRCFGSVAIELHQRRVGAQHHAFGRTAVGADRQEVEQRGEIPERR